MGRTVLHKHYDSAANITADKFFNGGELIISNEIGNEGIYILNTRGDVVKIGYNGGSGSGGTIPSGDYITGQDLRDYLLNRAYMTSADTAELLSAIETAVSGINENVGILSATTEEHIGQNTEKFQSIDERIDALSGLTAEILTEEQIKDIVIGEISFLVSSADTMFDVLRGLADWVANDETGSAQLIADVTNLKDAVSGVTDRVSTLEGGVSEVEDGLAELSGSVVEHIAQNEADLQELDDKIESIDIPEPVSDEHIQDIAAQEVAKLVSSADSMYQVLQELADWVESDESGSAQLIADVATLNDSVDELSAETESLKNIVENLPIPSGSPVDESVIQALKDYIDEKIASIQHESDHVFLSRAEYNELLREGHVMIDGKMHYFSDSVYYCIYQGGSPEPPTPSGETVDYEISGDTIIFNNGTVDEDGFLNIGDITLDGDFIDLNAVTPIVPDEPDEPDEPDTEPVISGDTMSLENATVDEEGFINAPTFNFNSIIE